MILIFHLTGIHYLKTHITLCNHRIQSAVIKIYARDTIGKGCCGNGKIRRTTSNFKYIFFLYV